MSDSQIEETKFKTNDWVYYQNNLYQIDGVDIMNDKPAYALRHTAGLLIVYVEDGDKYFTKA